MNIELALENLKHAQEILIAIHENRPVKNYLYGIFDGENEYLTTDQKIHSYRITLESAGKFIY